MMAANINLQAEDARRQRPATAADFDQLVSDEKEAREALEEEKSFEHRQSAAAVIISERLDAQFSNRIPSKDGDVAVNDSDQSDDDDNIAAISKSDEPADSKGDDAAAPSAVHEIIESSLTQDYGDFAGRHNELYRTFRRKWRSLRIVLRAGCLTSV